MKRLFSQLHRPLRNERGEITFFACFFVVGVVMLISFLLLYASVRITCINIRNGAKMELNNLSATIYADTYRSQRETNFEEYLRTLYSSRDYTEMLEATVAGGLAEKVPLSTDDYTVSDISLEFNVVGDRVEYIFYCDVDFYVRMFGHSYPTITQRRTDRLPQHQILAVLLKIQPELQYRLYITAKKECITHEEVFPIQRLYRYFAGRPLCCHPGCLLVCQPGSHRRFQAGRIPAQQHDQRLVGWRHTDRR